jgi:alkanesulfonate monooxygenase SsuD/methylene tetrahydromethanopterin reductase-like flavin-dependent oxidoreductase (luciferase family)
VRVGLTLPQYRNDAEPALAVAAQADALGIDGLFVFDHLWPLRQPERPALHSFGLLGALAVETSRAHLGTLVARVSLFPDAVLVNMFSTLQRMIGDRLIAGLGTGDSANRDENIAYGVPFPPRAVRLADLRACCRELRAIGVRTWVGGTSAEARAAAADSADGWNGWGTDAVAWTTLAADLPVRDDFDRTWAGQVLLGRAIDDAADKLERLGTRPGLVHGTVDDLRRHFVALQEAGASWAICAPLDVGTDPAAVEMVAEAAAAAT